MTIFIVFYFYLILRDLSSMVIVDSALPPSMLLTLLLVISFCSLSFCTWCCFFSADKEGFLTSSLQILLYPVFCIRHRLSAWDCSSARFFLRGGGGINTRYKL